MDAKDKQLNDANKEGVQAPSSSVENHDLGIKRIRTYAEDLALAKEKAGVTDEAPKEKRGFFSRKKKESKKDLSKVQPKVDVPKKVVEKTKDEQPSKEYIQRELAKSGIVAAPEVLKDEDEEEEKSSVSPIRTYKYDAAESIEKGGTSQISMVAAEQRRKVANNDFSKTFSTEPVESTKTGIILVLVSVALVVSGVWGGIHFYNKSKITDEPVVTVSKNVLFTDNSVTIDAYNKSGLAFNELLLGLGDTVNGSLNDLTEVTLTDRGIFGESKLSKNDFFSKLESNVPPRLIRNLGNDYLVGVHSGAKESIFYLFKIEDFDTVFAGVLEWERTMHGDLYGTALATQFADKFIRNKDTRVQGDGFGNTKLIYSFPNSETLLITQTEEAFFEVFERLTVSNATSN